MRSLRGQLPFALLMLAAAPLILHFVWHPGIASVGDDSVGYLILAQHFAGSASPFVREWVAYHAYFPPLFSLVLAATGVSADFLGAHLVVGACAVLALAMLYRYAAFQLASSRAGVATAAMFLLTPTAWTSITGILSEPLFLLLTLAALHWHATRLAGRGSPARARDALLLGILLGLALLTRSAGAALVAAYLVHAAIRALSDRAASPGVPEHALRRGVLAVPLLVCAAMAALWAGLRPASDGVSYGGVLAAIGRVLFDDPRGFLALGTRSVADAWVASFASEPGVHPVTRGVFLALGVLAAGGAAMRARRNALDGWYSLATLAMLFTWPMGEDTLRRLLYPLVPVALVQAFAAARGLAAHVRPALAARLLPFALFLPPVLLCLPAVGLVHLKSVERAPAIAGFPYAFAGITDFYTTIALQRARAEAARNIAVLVGLHALRTDTPPGAKVMWVRPDYVALLGDRQGVAWRGHAGERGLAEGLRDSAAGYVVVATLYKADVEGRYRDPLAGLEAPPPFLRPVAVTRNAVHGAADFTLMQVDAAALAAYLAAR